MALRGSLRDFSLPDVLQLIGLSRKTGVLRITGAGDDTGSIWLRDGEVFFAQSNWQRTKLGERLVSAQKITPSALARVLTVHAADPRGRRIGQIFVDEGYITQSVLEAFVQEQIQDTIFDLMRWEDGDFGFDPLPDELEEDIGLSVSIENIIMEGSRRLEEWQRLKNVIPSMDIVFSMSAAPGLSGFEISLKPVEWNLLMLIDGTRSVAELARKTGQTDFEVARVIHGLFSAGLLEIAPYVEPEELPVRPAEEAAVAEAEPAPPAELTSAASEPGETGSTGVREPASVALHPTGPSEEEIIEEILYARHSGRVGSEPVDSEAPVATPDTEVPFDGPPQSVEDIQVLEEEWARASGQPPDSKVTAGEAVVTEAQEGEPVPQMAAAVAPDGLDEIAPPAEPIAPAVPLVAPRGTAMDVGLGSAISDEIAALTGAARTVRATAAPDRSSEVAGAALQRDVSVDRETVLKIIHAVEKL